MCVVDTDVILDVSFILSLPSHLTNEWNLPLNLEHQQRKKRRRELTIESKLPSFLIMREQSLFFVRRKVKTKCSLDFDLKS